MPHRNQFSLLHALGLMTAVAFLMGIAVLPEMLRSLVAYLLHGALLTVAIAAIVFGRGLVRAFWIGWLVPIASLRLGIGQIYGMNEEGTFLLLLLVYNAFCGALSYGTARWLRASSPEEAPDKAPPPG